MTKARSNATAPNAKGTLVVGNGTDASTTLAVASTAGYVLTVDSAEATGLKWAAASSPSFVGASVYSTVNLSIANTTYLLLTWDAEYFDSDNFHSTSTNTSRLTIPTGKGGKYLISGYIWFGPNATGYRVVELMKNSAAVTYFQFAPFSGDSTTVPMSYIMNLTAGDYVEVRAWQSSGGSLNFIGGTQNASFQISYLGA